MSVEQQQGAMATEKPISVPRDRLLSRLSTRVRGRSPDTLAMLMVVATVIVANLVYLLDFSDPNPLGPRSGLIAGVGRGLTGGQPTIDPNNGFASQALGHRADLDLVHLHLPWWNSYEGTGMPLAGEMQSAAFFPPTWLLLLSNGQLYEHILLEIIAGLSTYLLLRRLSLNRWASGTGAIAFALNGTFAWLALATVNPVPFLPLLLLGIEQAYAAARAGRRGGWWLIAVAGALSFYAGFPEVTYIDSLMAIAWLAWRCACLGRARLRPFATKALASGAVGALLCAPLLIAMADYFRHADLGAHESGLLGALSLPHQALPQLLLPYVYGPIFAFSDAKGILPGLWGSVGGYLTVSLLLFAVIGLLANGRRGLRLILLAWIVLVFSRIYGTPHVLSDVLGLLPDMSRIAFFRYATPSLELPVVILAAIGLDDLATVPEHRRRVVWGALVMVAVVGLAALEARTLTTHLAGVGTRSYFRDSLAWAVAILVAAAAFTFVRKPLLRVQLMAALLAFDALAMFVVPERSAPRAVRLDLAPAAYLQRHLGDARVFTLGPLQPNYGSYFGLASLNVNDFPPKAFAAYVHARLDQFVDPTVFVGNSGGGRFIFAPSPEQELLRNLPYYRQAGVAYVLTSPAQALPQSPSTFTLVFRSPSARIYRLAGSAPYFTAADPRCSVSSQSRASVGVACPSPTVLIRRETAFPGWTATVDGHPARIDTTDGLFQAVTVGSGVHRVRFSYTPPTIGWGYLGFGLGCAWLLLAAWHRRVGHAGH